MTGHERARAMTERLFGGPPRNRDERRLLGEALGKNPNHLWGTNRPLFERLEDDSSVYAYCCEAEKRCLLGNSACEDDDSSAPDAAEPPADAPLSGLWLREPFISR